MEYIIICYKIKLLVNVWTLMMHWNELIISLKIVDMGIIGNLIKHLKWIKFTSYWYQILPIYKINFISVFWFGTPCKYDTNFQL